MHNCGQKNKTHGSSYIGMGIVIQVSNDTKHPNQFKDNAITSDTTSNVVGYTGSQASGLAGTHTTDEFNGTDDYYGTGIYDVSGNVNTYPDESSTEYGAGPKENCGHQA